MNVLDRIFARKREDLPGRIAMRPLADVVAAAKDAPPSVSFAQTLIDSAHSPALIAEVKRASPVKGTIREDFDPIAIARAYRDADADCLSVLTDAEFFGGAPEYLTECRRESGLPTLRKDFTISEYDVYEARAIGADAILLIANGLDDHELLGFRLLAESLAMDAIVEVHTAEEADRALNSGASLVGVNNRDLATFETNIEASEKMIPGLPSGVIAISESALHTRYDVARVAKAGARAVLIGTAFCQQPDVGSAVKDVMGW